TLNGLKKKYYTPNGLELVQPGAQGRVDLLAIFCLSLLPFLASSNLASAQTNLPLLTAAEQVHQLGSEAAKLQYPVRVRGVATFVDESIEQLFIQDKSGGIFVEIHGDYGFALRSGQLLEVEGVSAPGGFAPDIEPRSVRLLGEAPLPIACRV